MAAADITKTQTNSGDVISRNIHNGLAFHEYPPSRPFINDDYRRDVTKPIIAYPESNRHGMIRYECFLKVVLIAFSSELWMFLCFGTKHLSD